MMDDFEFFFTLFGLLLGFSLVEVISGFGRAIERALPPGTDTEAPRARIGWLTPLLGLAVIFNLVSFWTAAWSLRDAVPVHYLSLLFGLVVTGGYYLAASLVFPRDIKDGSDLDHHYFQIKRWVLLAIISCNALGATGMTLISTDFLPSPVDLLFYGLLIALLSVSGRRANFLLLVPIVAGYPLASLIAYAL